MRLTKGAKVEALSKKEVPFGSWYCVEILSGNGRIYYVKYESLPGTSNGEVERVPRKLIRPRPPQVLGLDSWVLGDIVEVFHNLSWKTARIVNVEGGNSYIVRLVGSVEELRACKSYLRVRQAWKDNKWFTLSKGGWDCTASQRLKLAEAKASVDVQSSCFPAECTELNKPCVLTSGFKANHVVSRKQRVVEKDLTDENLHSQYLEKIGVLVIPNKVSGKNLKLSSSKKRKSESSVMNIGGSMDHLQQRTSLSTNTESSASSVGSCSYGDLRTTCSFTSRQNTDDNDECSDAESFCGREYHEEADSQPQKRRSVAGSRVPGLEAYRHALEALFAFGSISWEDEMNMSNLRQYHQISNDEHLMIVRSLVSSDSRHLSVDTRS